MRLLGFIVAVSIGLALMQAAAKLAVVIAIIAGLSAFIRRPQESIGCLALVLLLGLVGRFPVAGMLVLAILALIGRFGRTTDSRQGEQSTHSK